jgi:hypothetical protein
MGLPAESTFLWFCSRAFATGEIPQSALPVANLGGLDDNGLSQNVESETRFIDRNIFDYADLEPGCQSLNHT